MFEIRNEADTKCHFGIIQRQILPRWTYIILTSERDLRFETRESVCGEAVS